MKNTYEVKTDIFGVDYLEMTSPNGVISFVPMDESNADYQAYLNKDTLASELSNPSTPQAGE